jgi:hypothetical protein
MRRSSRGYRSAPGRLPAAGRHRQPRLPLRRAAHRLDRGPSQAQRPREHRTGQTCSAAEAGARLRAVLGTPLSRLLTWPGRYHPGHDVTGGRPSAKHRGAGHALTAAGYSRLSQLANVLAELKKLHGVGEGIAATPGGARAARYVPRLGPALHAVATPVTTAERGRSGTMSRTRRRRPQCGRSWHRSRMKKRQRPRRA